MTMLSTTSFSGCEFFKLQSRVTRALAEGRYDIPNIYKTLLGPKYRNAEQKRFKKIFPFIQEQFPYLFLVIHSTFPDSRGTYSIAKGLATHLRQVMRSSLIKQCSIGAIRPDRGL